MEKASEILDRLHYEWLPRSIIAHVRSHIQDVEYDYENPLVVTSIVCGWLDLEKKRIAPRIARLRERTIRAVARAVHRAGYDWATYILDCQDPSELHEVMDTVGMWGGIRQISSEWGEEVAQAIRRRFGTYEKFCDWLRAANPILKKQKDRGVELQENLESNQALKQIQECTAPEQMKVLFREMGLPGDFYKSYNQWLGCIWRSQKIILQPRAIAVRKALARDPRFFGRFHFAQGWLDGCKLGNTKDPDLVEVVEDRYHRWQESHRKPGHFNRDLICHFMGYTTSRNTDVLVAEAKKRRKVPEALLSHFDEAMRVYPYERLERGDYDAFLHFRPEREVHPWGRLCCPIDQRAKFSDQATENSQTPEVLAMCQHLGNILWEYGDCTCCQCIDWCVEPYDFERLFLVLGILPGQWRDRMWLLSREQGKKNGKDGKKDFTDLVMAIEMRFGSYDEFLAWMAGRASERTLIRERVRTFKSSAEFLAICKELDVPGDAWKSITWMTGQAKLPPEQGGIGKDLTMLVDAIEDRPVRSNSDEETASYEEYVTHIHGGVTHPSQAWEIVQQYAERYSDSMDQFLRPENQKLMEEHPRLLDAIALLRSQRKS
ncbi:MAG: hypothetical protein PHO92_01805 [Candidatus Peribacteraceae bacterium]|nr:hypothetical protein [Candidatus Peribacteraceae bacterium]